MAEFIVILAWGVLVLYGPGGDVIKDLRDVLLNSHRGYTYALSMSPPPDFPTGTELRTHLESVSPAIADEEIEKLTVDPIEQGVMPALAPLSNLTSEFTGVDDLLSALPDIADIVTEMATDAISPF